MTWKFDTDTQLRDLGDGVFDAHLTHRWSIGAVPNGGYSSAPAIAAMLQATDRDVPLSVTTHFYKPTTPDTDARIETEVHRAGRTAVGWRDRDGLRHQPGWRAGRRQGAEYAGEA